MSINNTVGAFYLQSYSVGRVVTDHSVNERGNLLLLFHGLFFTGLFFTDQPQQIFYMPHLRVRTVHTRAFVVHPHQNVIIHLPVLLW